MATITTARAFDVVALDDIEPGVEGEHDGRVPFNVRRHFGISGFGIRALRSVGDGHVIGEHDEVSLGGTGQEELYYVLSGTAQFDIDGDPVYAPAGTFVFVRDPAARRSAVAKEAGTTVLAIGGTPGKPYEPHVGEFMNDMWEPYRAGDYKRALETLQHALEQRPEALVLFNVACMEARLGRTDEAIAHLEQAVQDDERIKQHIRTDEDLESLRADPRFAALAA